MLVAEVRDTRAFPYAVEAVPGRHSGQGSWGQIVDALDAGKRHLSMKAHHASVVVHQFRCVEPLLGPLAVGDGRCECRPVLC